MGRHEEGIDPFKGWHRRNQLNIPHFPGQAWQDLVAASSAGPSPAVAGQQPAAAAAASAPSQQPPTPTPQRP